MHLGLSLLADDRDMDTFDILAINYDAGITSKMSIEQISTVEPRWRIAELLIATTKSILCVIAWAA